MMTPADEIAKLPSGARFWRADLHIHSFGASHDVKDSSMTPAGIVATALAEHLSLIAVTDHNEITNVQDTIREAYGKGIAVVPASNSQHRKATFSCISKSSCICKPTGES